MNTNYNQAIALLDRLITTSSSGDKDKKIANHIEQFLADNQVDSIRKCNNIWAYNKYFDPAKPIALLNSHDYNFQLDSQHTSSSFFSPLKDVKFYELNSQYSAARMVSLIATFLNYYQRKDLPFNLCLAATSEQKGVSKQGIKFIPVKHDANPIPNKEKRMMVLECRSICHTNDTDWPKNDNAIFNALRDIHWFTSYHFPIEDGQPIPVKITVTQIKAVLEHKIIPTQCTFKIIIWFDHSYSKKEILTTVDNHTFCEAKVCSTIGLHQLGPNILSY